MTLLQTEGEEAADTGDDGTKYGADCGARISHGKARRNCPINAGGPIVSAREPFHVDSVPPLEG